MLIGEYKHSLDGKGRLSIPAKFRSELGASAIVTKGLEGCLFMYPKSQWELMASRLSNMPVSSSNARAFSRLMLSGAMEVEIDRLGRALLPGYLREYAALEGETVITGVYNRVEIWDKKSWAEYSKNAEKNSADIAETLTEWEI
ncbi:MAG: division/cell wall cluster transcriptional repressor MraZ [bacterium]|nr:division/cell wall cluster transcriptional repressor MraZ [bacterium]